MGGSDIHSAAWGGQLETWGGQLETWGRQLEIVASSALLVQVLKRPRAPQEQICSHSLPTRPSSLAQQLL